MSVRSLPFALILAVSLANAADSGAIKQAVTRVEETAAKAPAAMSLDFQLLAAQALQQRHTDLSRQFIDRTLGQLRASKDPVAASVIMALASVAPADAVAIIPKIAPKGVPTLISALARSEHGVEASKLFEGILAATHFDALDPSDAYSVIVVANSIALVNPALAADAYEKVLQATSNPEYGKKSDTTLTATFQIGTTQVQTTTSRDTLLVMAGSRLRTASPDRFAKFKDLLSQWDLSGPATLRAFSNGTATPTATPRSPEAAAISKGIGQMRGLATDAERAKLVLDLVAQVRALPAGSTKVALAFTICTLTTEGDLGKDALNGVATTLALALRETDATVDPYMELATLVRYEHVTSPPADPAFTAATAILQLRDEILQETGFTLPGIDGKTYNLDGLRGKVVLLNFWATWCPPCRKEMPDMEKLYQRFSKQGLVVLAVSDEDSDTVMNFLKKQNYTFPIALDPGRKTNTAFAVQGIPKSFLFDRQGKLVARAIDMRTESQFLEMFKAAGLE